MDVDSLIVQLGGFGRYQLLRYMALALFAVFDGLQTFSIVFVAAKAEFECKLGIHNYSEIISDIAEVEAREVSLVPGDSCRTMNASDVSAVLHQTGGNVSIVTSILLANYSSIKCIDGFTFLPGQYKTSIVSEFELVCDRELLRTAAQASYFVGKLIGLICTGRLSDRFGRKRVFIGCLIFTAVGGLGAAAAPNVYVFYCCFLLHGSLGAYYVAFTLATELVGPKHRVATGVGIAFFFSLGYALLAPLAYFVQNWRYLLVIINAPCLLFVGYWWVLDESLRWLLVRNNDDEARKILLKIAKTNRTTLPADVVSQVKKGLLEEGPRKGKATIIDLFRNKRIVFLIMAVWYNWIINAMGYYGFSFYTDSLVGNMYVNLTFTALSQIAGNVLCIILVDRTGRKKLMFASLLIAGISCLLGGLLKDKELLVVFSMIGKLAITASFSIMYLITAEIFPTEIRNFAITGSAVVSKFGAMSSPFIIQLQTIWSALPFVILGATSLVASALTLFFPETAGKALPQTIEDILSAAKNRKQDIELQNTDEKLLGSQDEKN